MAPRQSNASSSSVADRSAAPPREIKAVPSPKSTKAKALPIPADFTTFKAEAGRNLTIAIGDMDGEHSMTLAAVPREFESTSFGWYVQKVGQLPLVNAEGAKKIRARVTITIVVEGSKPKAAVPAKKPNDHVKNSENGTTTGNTATSEDTKKAETPKSSSSKKRKVASDEEADDYKEEAEEEEKNDDEDEDDPGEGEDDAKVKEKDSSSEAGDGSEDSQD
ncbi:hypothetical protein BD324DRAFT_630288 [Kockovaella imperatae]|uniref:Uncharacterized protein n=1 Tax=Kockovaella imperatae TaxID=4999 RepID=A0A1Y1UDP8_9TREE|nr:hypothetical protein BD324DRAFT_630288 [Kockovaella imperatae]ORX36132.1 hypothetical protein BD324DRAFT_630288 [Kockovaella imperatae]